MVNEDDFLDDAAYDECDDDYDDDVVEYDYSLCHDKSSLDLIRTVNDFTDRNKILSSMFLAVPRNRYRSDFVPRKFAVKNEEFNDLAILDEWTRNFKNNSDELTTSYKTNKLSPASKERHVPSSRIGRLANFSSLGI